VCVCVCVSVSVCLSQKERERGREREGGGRNCAVGVVTGLRSEKPRNIYFFSMSCRGVSRLQNVYSGCGTHTASYPMNRTTLSPGVQRP
jgi:hypothetical protein